MVLKLGFGPNVSVVAAFLGYLALGVAFRNYNRWENNIVQTAGTSAAQTAFMCVILAAFDPLKQSKVLGYTFSPTPFQSFVWIAVGSILGLLLAVPLRRHYVVDEKLTYADGVAAAETIIVLDSRGKEARNPALFLLAGTVISGLVLFLTLPWGGHVLPEVVLATTFGLTAANSGSGLAISALGIGSGMIVGLRITVSMAIGATLAWIIAPQFLVPEDRRTARAPTSFSGPNFRPAMISAPPYALFLKGALGPLVKHTLSRGSPTPLSSRSAGRSGSRCRRSR